MLTIVGLSSLSLLSLFDIFRAEGRLGGETWVENNKRKRVDMGNPVVEQEIPDGLCEHLHEKIGGNLEATSVPNPCGHRRDSHFKIIGSGVVADAAIHAAVVAYYQAWSQEVVPCGDLCFEVRLKSGVSLWVSVSNYSTSTGRVLCNVETMA